MIDKEIDIRGIELQGTKKYIVSILEDIDKETSETRKGFGWLLRSKELESLRLFRRVVCIMLDDINEKIAKHIPS
ncbi:hypothetical protein [Enterobacter phage EspM4VN]|uniref:Uncharacterized protein n=1 Tax=Enterobacter phage EspM4VN TaxID=2137745 RepID=A0A4P2WVC6_9CAUD|nr:hypothetical protein HYP11_gp191 [Enterobacter phage EspM4VN]BBK03780.1 hypothetical protein [Enterobacter phage EspM4VN]